MAHSPSRLEVRGASARRLRMSLQLQSPLPYIAEHEPRNKFKSDASLGRPTSCANSLYQPTPIRGAKREDIIVEIIPRVMQQIGARLGTVADEDIGPRLLLQHKGKILGSHVGFVVGIDFAGACDLFGDPNGGLSMHGIGDGGGIVLPVVDLGIGAISSGYAVDNAAQPRLNC